MATTTRPIPATPAADAAGPDSSDPTPRPARPTPDGGASRIYAPNVDGERRPHGHTRVREAIALTFDDVLLSPRHAMVHPKDVSTATRFTRGITLHVPLVAAAMDSVCCTRTCPSTGRPRKSTG